MEAVGGAGAATLRRMRATIAAALFAPFVLCVSAAARAESPAPAPPARHRHQATHPRPKPARRDRARRQRERITRGDFRLSRDEVRQLQRNLVEGGYMRAP